MQLCPDKSIMNKKFLLLLASAILLACNRSSPAKGEHPADLPDETDESCLHINDRDLHQSFQQELTELFENGKTTKMATQHRSRQSNWMS